MSTETDDALLAAIYADLDDDAARAVYADRLLERGDPRGEFIALQIADARGGASEKDRKHIRGLLRTHWGAWGEPLYGAIDHGRSRFERGFLARVEGLNPSAAERVTMMIGHPIWATVRHVASVSQSVCYGELISHPVMRAVRSLELAADDVPAVAAIEAPRTLDTLTVRALPPVLAGALAALGEHPGCATARVLGVYELGGRAVDCLAVAAASKFATRADRLMIELRHFPGDRAEAFADLIAAFSADVPFRTLVITSGYLTVTGVRARSGVRAELGVRRDLSVDHARDAADAFVAACGARFACALEE